MQGGGIYAIIGTEVKVSSEEALMRSIQEKLENFWGSWPGIITLFMILALIYGSTQLFYPGGVSAFIQSGTTFEIPVEKELSRTPRG